MKSNNQVKKQIVLTLTLDVDVDPAKLDDMKSDIKQEVMAITDGVQNHFNKDLSNTYLSNTRIKTAFVKLDKVIDTDTGEEQPMN